MSKLSHNKKHHSIEQEACGRSCNLCSPFDTLRAKCIFDSSFVGSWAIRNSTADVVSVVTISSKDLTIEVRQFSCFWNNSTISSWFPKTRLNVEKMRPLVWDKVFNMRNQWKTKENIKKNLKSMRKSMWLQSVYLPMDLWINPSMKHSHRVYIVPWPFINFPPAFDCLPRDAARRVTKSMIFFPI